MGAINQAYHKCAGYDYKARLRGLAEAAALSEAWDGCIARDGADATRLMRKHGLRTPGRCFTSFSMTVAMSLTDASLGRCFTSRCFAAAQHDMSDVSLKY